MTKKKTRKIILSVGTLLSFLILILSAVECWWLLTPGAAKHLSSDQLGHAFTVYAGVMCVTLFGTGIGILGLLKGRKSN